MRVSIRFVAWFRCAVEKVAALLYRRLAGSKVQSLTIPICIVPRVTRLTHLVWPCLGGSHGRAAISAGASEKVAFPYSRLVK